MKDFVGDEAVNHEQATSIARAMLKVAALQGGVHLREQAEINGFYLSRCEEEGWSPEDLHAKPFDVEEARRLLTPGLKEALIRLCYQVACADGRCSSVEMAFLDELCAALELAPDRRDQILRADVMLPDEAQIAIVQRVFAHLRNKTTDISTQSRQQSVDDYTSRERYHQEQRRLFRRSPLLVGPSVLLPRPNSYITLDDHGIPLILSRDRDGIARAMLNVCRHRGARVAVRAEGNAKCFTCPYHAWTYDTAGQLIHIPHDRGFPDFAKTDGNLASLPLVEQYGALWLGPEPSAYQNCEATTTEEKPQTPMHNMDIDIYLGSLVDEFAGLNLARHQVYERSEERRAMNWKLVIEGFLEAYHIRSTHKDSFYSVVFDNLALHDFYGPHSRTIYPLRKITQLENLDKTEWGIRRVTSIIYHIFPNTIIAVEPYHICILNIIPVSEASTLIRSTVLVTQDKLRHKERVVDDIALLQRGLAEDYVIGESIQAGLLTNVNRHFHFGQFEGTLSHFHESIEGLLGGAPSVPVLAS